MRDRISFSITLLLSAIVALPAFAQQSNSTANTPSSASASQSTSTQQPAAREDFWDGEDPSLGALIFHPFATKAYVQRHVQPIRDRVNELEEITAANTKAIRDVDARAQRGLQAASAKADVADTHASEAAKQAEIAQQKATEVATRVTADATVVGNIDSYQSGAQTEIRFRPGQTVLSKQAKDALDEMAAPLKNQHGYILEVQGFSSGRGQAAIASSRKMADAVVRYLVLNYQIPAYRIYVLGMGDASTANSGSRSRVEVNVLKSDIAQVAKQ